MVIGGTILLILVHLAYFNTLVAPYINLFIIDVRTGGEES